MTTWQFRWLILAFIILNVQAAYIAGRLTYLGSDDTALARHVRWVTWKLDQTGSEKIKVSVD